LTGLLIATFKFLNGMRQRFHATFPATERKKALSEGMMALASGEGRSWQKRTALKIPRTS
jgi:hypothetical protein